MCKLKLKCTHSSYILSIATLFLTKLLYILVAYSKMNLCLLELGVAKCVVFGLLVPYSTISPTKE